MSHDITDNIALIDLDGTVADCDGALQEQQALLRSPDEPPFQDRYSGGGEPAYIEARRKLIQRQPGFWRNLRPLTLGFQVVGKLRDIGFNLHVLTKGPKGNGAAWGEKLDWSREHIPDALVTVGSDKSLVYGKILVDDFPEYFEKWLRVRPRGLVVCVAQAWNIQYADDVHPNVFRYDGTNYEALCGRLQQAYNRDAGK